METSKHDIEFLKELIALPLERKIAITQARIIEWYNYFDGKVYISTSGGKDSTVLYDIVHKLFPNVPAVFSDTGLEYPEIRQFVKESTENLTIIRPKMMFTDVVKTYGYPIVSKEVSECIYYARRIPAVANNTNESTPRGFKEAEWKQRELLGNRPECTRTIYRERESQGTARQRMLLGTYEKNIKKQATPPPRFASSFRRIRKNNFTQTSRIARNKN